MIRLSLLGGTVEADFSALYPGFKVQLLRLTTLELSVARRTAMRVLEKARDGVEGLAPYGLATPDAAGMKLDTSDLDQMTGVGELVGAVECCLLAFKSWEGVELEDGSVAPITRETLSLLLMDDTLRRYAVGKIDQAARVLVTEGNGSGPSRNGFSEPGATASAPITAAPASLGNRRARRAAKAVAPARSARKPKTPH